MATGFDATPRKEGTWTKLVIFVSLYCLILESILEWVLVLFLYGNHKVDSKMTVSLALALVSSFLMIPLVSLQSLVAWQYNKIGGFGEQKTVLHNVCTYVLRLDLMLWLAASVSGLVVAAQQVYCLPAGTDASYWRVGISCAFHRAAVIVSVASLVTVCTLYCARELCDRPYDVSIIGIYRRSQALRDDSIFSGHSWDSDETLKNEILNLCRQHDGKAGAEPWYLDPLADKVNCHPSIRHPAPVRLRPQLRVNTDPGSEYGEITSGTTISPDDIMPRISPGGQTITSDFYPISRTSTMMTSQTACESQTLLSSIFAPRVPPIPKEYTVNHKRGKSSLSSLKRFFPKSFPLSLPLSSDPQIRALVDPNAASDVEKQVVTPSTSRNNLANSSQDVLVDRSADGSSSPATQATTDSTQQTTRKPEGHTRTMTMNSADAPEVVVPAEPSRVRRSQTACLAPPPRSIHHPHHPNYIPGPEMPRKYSLSCRQNSAVLPLHVEPLRRTTSRQTNAMQYPVRSSSYSFEPPHIPRHTQSQYHLHWYPQPPRWPSQSTFDPSRTTPVPAIPRRNDVEVIYPSTRRPRSSTHSGFKGPLSCIMESSSTPRTSVNTAQVKAIGPGVPSNVIDQTMYRGANRTSLSFY
ncbi:hypothetical protein N7462_003744 [Penicillium macrosclerotiorum]|uniref:uncharacterized protein n=1 Tax=Penicillium macrosclerotiorum TaxID=303699 RepID=UPI00254865FF|nr:uncharacterized protein N7462_003744 [Penicillium macrosclerotiorum]KAJ5689352.1 hypothetical protein N7462_003744 [Penicillium macrosclerotiorum]